jgi:hypothetical protein
MTMKKKNIELDVDFIGGQEPLTKEEERLIHDYFQSKKRDGCKERIAKPRKKGISLIEEI